jgi:hypothetical protein
MRDGAYGRRRAGGREERDAGEGYTAERSIIVVRQRTSYADAAGVVGGGVQTPHQH